MNKLRVLSLFAGIGGFDLGLERTGGFKTVAFCEIEEFPRRVLAKHWPEVPCYHDVRELTGARLAADGITVDVITGGFPCQDISVAGKQAGIGEGTRSGLWSEIVRLVGELRPQFVIVENVANLLAGPSGKPGGWFGRILGDLAECGYDAEWENIPASALGAPHRRERIWLVAYTTEIRRNISSATNECKHAEPSEKRWMQQFGGMGYGAALFSKPSASYIKRFGNWFDAKPASFRMADGVPDGLDRLASLGNAVVPQIPELIGHAILDAIKSKRIAA